MGGDADAVRTDKRIRYDDRHGNCQRREIEGVVAFIGIFNNRIVHAPTGGEAVGIIAETACQGIHAGAASEDVVPGVAGQGVVAQPTSDVLDARHASHAAAQFAGRQIDSHRGDVAGVVEGIAARTAVKRGADYGSIGKDKAIITGTTFERFCACAHDVESVGIRTAGKVLDVGDRQGIGGNVLQVGRLQVEG